MGHQFSRRHKRGGWPKERNNPMPAPNPPGAPKRWYMTDYHHTWIEDLLFITLTTDVPCHLWIYWTSHETQMHNHESFVGGVGWLWDPRFCFVEYHKVEQDEPGDTLVHHFHFSGWYTCEWRWWVFAGEIEAVRSPSISPIMKAHYQSYIQDEPTYLVPDVKIITDVNPTEQRGRTSRSLVWVNESTGYLIYQQTGGDLVWRKTTDYGKTWSPTTWIFRPTFGTIGWYDVWYDRWTPGVATKQICIAAHLRITTTYVAVRFRTLDTATDTLSPMRTVYSKSGEIGVGSITSITRTRDQSLYIVANKTNVSVGFWHGSADGTIWVEMNQPTNRWNDHPILWPGGEPDPEDCWCVNWRVEAPYNIDFKSFDQSANTWTFATVTTGGNRWPGSQGMAGAIDHSSKDLYLTLFDGPRPIDTGDIRIFDIGSVASITELTKIRTAINGIRGLAILFDQELATIFVAYAKTSVVIPYDEGEILYNISRNVGYSWSETILYSHSPAGYTGQANSLRMSNSVLLADRGRLSIIWTETPFHDFYTNLVNDYRIPLTPG